MFQKARSPGHAFAMLAALDPAGSSTFEEGSALLIVENLLALLHVPTKKAADRGLTGLRPSAVHGG
jgi:hypothetical protein